jgi:hypothetical protein
VPGPEFDIQPGHVDAFDVQPGHVGKPTTTATGAFVDHGANAAAFGFGDEMVGGYKALAKKILPESMGGAPAGTRIGDIYRHDRDEVRQRFATEADEHPVASTAGDFAGALVSTAALPGGAEAAEIKALAEAGAGAAARKLALTGAAKTGAALGAVNGLGNSNADLTKGDVGGAVADTAKGAALGAGAAVVGQKVGEKIGQGLGAAKDALEDLAQRKAVNALRPTAGEVGKLVDEHNLEPLGDWLLRNKVVEAGDTYKDVLEKATGIQKASGKALEGILAELDATGATIPKQKLVEAFTDLAGEAEARGPGAAPLVKKYLAEAEAVSNRPEQNLTFSQAEEWKRGFQDRVNYAKRNPSVAQQGDEQLAQAARNVVETEAQAAAQKSGTDLADRFMLAKTTYGNAAKAADMAEGGLARAEARNIASPSDKFTAGGALVTGVLTGHPLAGVAGAVVAPVVNKVVRERAASTMAAGAQSLSQKVARLAQTSPAKLGGYGQILAGALQRGGQDAFDAHMYVLGQTDPKFQALTKKLSEEQQP